jgi:hypothetical protein
MGWNGQVELCSTPQGVKVIRFDLQVLSSNAFSDKYVVRQCRYPLAVCMQFARADFHYSSK